MRRILADLRALLLVLLYGCAAPAEPRALEWSRPVFDSLGFWEWQTTDGDVVVGMTPDSAIGWWRGRTQLRGRPPVPARRLLERAQELHPIEP